MITQTHLIDETLEKLNETICSREDPPFSDHWSDYLEPTEASAILEAFAATLLANQEELLEAVRAGGRYSDALRRLQDEGASGDMVEGTDELDRLFMDWHDKGHAVIAKFERQAAQPTRHVG